ncbi:hypothetical protein F5I97DRAFT_1827020 [Phlebopus sp. FC_14]|nr:hypothetical protein F5I97DRAFT_1827020 [Phlebopus sp. FC_14]
MFQGFNYEKPLYPLSTNNSSYYAWPTPRSGSLAMTAWGQTFAPSTLVADSSKFYYTTDDEDYAAIATRRARNALDLQVSLDSRQVLHPDLPPWGTSSTATPRQRSLCCGENVNRNKYDYDGGSMFIWHAKAMWRDCDSVPPSRDGDLIPLVNDKEPPDRPLRHWTYTFFGIIRLNFMSLTHGNAFENSAHDDFELWGSKRARTRVCVRSADPKPKGRSIRAVLAHGTTDRQDEDHNGPGLTIQSVMSTGVETTFVSSVVPALVGGYISFSNLNVPTTV